MFAYPLNFLTSDHVNLDHTVTPYWHFNIETHYVISFSLGVTVNDDIYGVGCDDLLGRLHVVTMWLISTVWTPVDDSTTLQRFAICYEGVLHFTLVMHSSYFSFNVCWIWEVVESVLFLWSAVLSVSEVMIMKYWRTDLFIDSRSWPYSRNTLRSLHYFRFVPLFVSRFSDMGFTRDKRNAVTKRRTTRNLWT